MAKLNDRERKMILSAGIFLVVILVYLFLLEPFMSSKDVVSEKLESSYQRYQDYHAILANEGTYQEQYQARKSDMIAVSRLLLSGNTWSLASAKLEEKVQKYAEESGVSITRSNTNQPVPIDHHQQISIQLNMSCDITALRDFLKRIEDDTNLLIVNSLEVNAPASMRRSIRKGSYSRRERSLPENLRVTMTISGIIEGDVSAEGRK